MNLARSWNCAFWEKNENTSRHTFKLISYLQDHQPSTVFLHPQTQTFLSDLISRIQFLANHLYPNFLYAIQCPRHKTGTDLQRRVVSPPQSRSTIQSHNSHKRQCQTERKSRQYWKLIRLNTRTTRFRYQQ